METNMFRSVYFKQTIAGLAAVALIQTAAILIVDSSISGDSVDYLQIGKNLYEKSLFSFDGINPSRMRQPVYPAFLSLAYFAMGQSLLFVKILQALMGFASFAFVLKLYHLISGTADIRVAAVICGAYVPLWWNCGFVLSESISIMLISGFMLCYYAALTRWRWPLAVAAGLLLGTAILTRPISIGLLSFAWIPIAFDSRVQGRRILLSSLLVGSCLLVMLPWAVRNYYSCQTFTPLSAEGEYHVTRASNFSMGMSKDSIVRWETSRDSLESRSVVGAILREIRERPVSYLWNGIKRVFGTWSYFPGTRDYLGMPAFRIVSHGTQLTLLLLAIYGLRALDADKRRFLIYPVLSFSVVIFFSSEGISRLILPIMPVVLIAAIVGLLVVLDTIKTRRITAR